MAGARFPPVSVVAWPREMADRRRAQTVRRLPRTRSRRDRRRGVDDPALGGRPVEAAVPERPGSRLACSCGARSKWSPAASCGGFSWTRPDTGAGSWPRSRPGGIGVASDGPVRPVSQDRGLPGRLRVGLSSSCKPPVRLEMAKLRLARLLGADSFFLPDHLRTNAPAALWSESPIRDWVPSADAFLDPLGMLAAMAAGSRRIGLGVGGDRPVSPSPATLAQPSTPSIIFGAVGHPRAPGENLEPYGISFEHRVTRLEEGISLIRRLWESGGQPVDFDGPTWRFRKAISPRPSRWGASAIWIGAHSHSMLRLTGAQADGWYPTIRMAADEYAAKLSTIRAAAAAAGRSRERFVPAKQIFPRARLLATERPRGDRSLILSRGRCCSRSRAGLGSDMGSPIRSVVSAASPISCPRKSPPACSRRFARMQRLLFLAEGVFAGAPWEVLEEIRPLVGPAFATSSSPTSGQGSRRADRRPPSARSPGPPAAAAATPVACRPVDGADGVCGVSRQGRPRRRRSPWPLSPGFFGASPRLAMPTFDVRAGALVLVILPSSRGRIVPFALPAAVVGATAAFYNLVTFGHVLGGYGWVGEPTILRCSWRGSAKGSRECSSARAAASFLFSPFLLFLFASFGSSMPAGLRPLLLAFLPAAGAQLLLYACFFGWTSGVAWGRS